MLSERGVIERLIQYGHFRNPMYPNGFNVTEVGSLTLRDKVVQDAIASIQDFMAEPLDRLMLKHGHTRRSRADGVMGPATYELLEMPRCGRPDYEEFSLGSGSWPMPCQKTGVTFSVDKGSMPSALDSRIELVIEEMVAAYGSVGLRLVRVGTGGNIRISWKFLAGGTIGLAYYNNGSCSDSVNAYLDTGYTGLMWELLTHEVGHCNRLNHTRRGVMAPSIERVEPHTWQTTDPSYPTLVNFFDGVPIDGPNPPPPPTPPPPTPIPPVPPRGFLRRLMEWLGF